MVFLVNASSFSEDKKMFEMLLAPFQVVVAFAIVCSDHVVQLL